MKSIDIEYNQKRSQHRKYGRIQECFYCGKNKKCIQSHSISQSHCLNQLSEEINKQKGVYGFDSITWNWSNWYDGNIIPGEFKLVGTNIASTFTGFCDNDDRTIFSLIDNYDFDDNSPEQCFLYCYRAFARGYHKKREDLKSCESDSKFANENPDYVTRRGYECNIGLTLDMGNFPILMNEWLDNKEFNKLHHFYFRTKVPLPMASSSFTQPSFDIMQHRINDYRIHVPFNHIFLNIIPEEKVTHILISCFESQKKSIQFVDSIKDMYNQGNKDKVGTFLTTFLIFFTENTFFKPSLINDLPYYQKRNLLLSLRNSITDNVQDYFLNNPINESLNLFGNTL